MAQWHEFNLLLEINMAEKHEMNYMNPKMVKSPKSKVKNLKVLEDTGVDNWSLARLEWEREGNKCLGIRWNGNFDSVGTPQSRGLPTWFILPNDPKFMEILNKEMKKIHE